MHPFWQCRNSRRSLRNDTRLELVLSSRRQGANENRSLGESIRGQSVINPTQIAVFHTMALWQSKAHSSVPVSKECHAGVRVKVLLVSGTLAAASMMNCVQSEFSKPATEIISRCVILNGTQRALSASGSLALIRSAPDVDHKVVHSNSLPMTNDSQSLVISPGWSSSQRREFDILITMTIEVQKMIDSNNECQTRPLAEQTLDDFDEYFRSCPGMTFVFLAPRGG